MKEMSIKKGMPCYRQILRIAWELSNAKCVLYLIFRENNGRKWRLL